MKVQYERYNFADLTVEAREREIEVAELLRGNCLLQLLAASAQRMELKERAKNAPKADVKPD
jgi:hypothetical protein